MTALVRLLAGAVRRRDMRYAAARRSQLACMRALGREQPLRDQRLLLLEALRSAPAPRSRRCCRARSRSATPAAQMPTRVLLAVERDAGLAHGLADRRAARQRGQRVRRARLEAACRSAARFAARRARRDRPCRWRCSRAGSSRRRPRRCAAAASPITWSMNTRWSPLARRRGRRSRAARATAGSENGRASATKSAAHRGGEPQDRGPEPHAAGRRGGDHQLLGFERRDDALHGRAREVRRAAAIWPRLSPASSSSSARRIAPARAITWTWLLSVRPAASAPPCSTRLACDACSHLYRSLGYSASPISGTAPRAR